MSYEIIDQADYLIYSRDILHKHSKAVRDFVDFFICHINNAFEREKEGKRSAWTGFLEPSFLYGCGVTPLEITNMARLCKQSDIRYAEEFFQIPEEVCGMYKGFMGGFYSYKDCPVKNIIFGSFGCEPQAAANGYARDYGFESTYFDQPRFIANPTLEQLTKIREKSLLEMNNSNFAHRFKLCTLKIQYLAVI